MASRHLLAGLIAAGATTVVAVLFALSVWVADVPDRTSGTLLAIFPPHTPAEAGVAAIIAAGGRPIRDPIPGHVWVADANGDGFAGRLRQQGAMLVLDDRWPFGPVFAGCAAYLPVPGAPPPVAERLDWMR